MRVDVRVGARHIFVLRRYDYAETQRDEILDFLYKVSKHIQFSAYSGSTTVYKTYISSPPSSYDTVSFHGTGIPGTLQVAVPQDRQLQPHTHLHRTTNGHVGAVHSRMVQRFRFLN